MEEKHFELFPRSLYNVLEHYDVASLRLSLTQGRWTPGMGKGVAGHVARGKMHAPTGADLRVRLRSEGNDDDRWRGLMYSLSALFGVSFAELDHTNTARSSPSSLSDDDGYRYGSLPQEVVCTENLTPFVRLLPCTDQV